MKVMTKAQIIREHYAEIGSKGGKIGGPARMAAQTPEERRELAKRAAAVRWGKPAPSQAPEPSSAPPVLREYWLWLDHPDPKELPPRRAAVIDSSITRKQAAAIAVLRQYDLTTEDSIAEAAKAAKVPDTTVRAWLSGHAANDLDGSDDPEFLKELNIRRRQYAHGYGKDPETGEVREYLSSWDFPKPPAPRHESKNDYVKRIVGQVRQQAAKHYEDLERRGLISNRVWRWYLYASGEWSYARIHRLDPDGQAVTPQFIGKEITRYCKRNNLTLPIVRPGRPKK
jgi:hypothetical protein